MKSKLKIIVALICVIALAASATFAWSHINQAKNEFFGRGRRIIDRDDYCPDIGKKDVYVENIGDCTVYVRVKLDEVLNIGSHTWRPATSNYGDAGYYNDWVTHTYDLINDVAEDCGHSNHQTPSHLFHHYFKWTMGGQKWYMPGLLLDADSENSVVQDKTLYNGTEPGVRQTPYAEIISATEYLAMGEADQKAFIGWIFAADGYAYWSQPLPSGEATGLLLHWVDKQNLTNLSYYYAINVIFEAVDKSDIPMWTTGAAPSTTGDPQLQEADQDGKDILAIIVLEDDDCDPPPTTGPGARVSINGGNRTISVGQEVQLTVNLSPPGYATGKFIDWVTSDEGIVAVDDAGKITGIAVGTAQITLIIGEGDEEITATITVTVTDSTVTPTPTPTGNPTPTPTPTPTPGPDLPVGPGPFEPIFNGDPAAGNTYFAKWSFEEPDNPDLNTLYHIGSIHLEDIITDGNYSGVSISVPSKYSSSIRIGNDRSGKPSILFDYVPDNAESVAWFLAHDNVEIDIPVQVTLTRGSQSATINIVLMYRGCMIGMVG